MNATKTKPRNRHEQVESGKRYGRLVAIQRVKVARTRFQVWECQCDCGSRTEVRSDCLKSGKTKSCGCLRDDSRKDPARNKFVVHGLCNHELYKTWSRMKERCHNERDTNYSRYGGRGIKVCERWRWSFPAFLEDMGERPSANHQLDRINNDGNYCPENCRWVPREVQSRNRRTNQVVEINGERMCLTDWAQRYGVNPKTAFKRIRLGMTPVEAVTRPVR